MRMTFRALPAWPYPPRAKGQATFRSTYAQTLEDLEHELRQLKASEIILGVVAGANDVRLDGQLRANAKVMHPGVELSFEVPGGKRMTFHTDAFRGYADSWQDNLRAIALGLKALRAVDRYGITETAEQYAGFAQLTDGGPSAERGRALVAEAGGVAEALKRHHPDHGGETRAFADVQAYRALMAGKEPVHG